MGKKKIIEKKSEVSLEKGKADAMPMEIKSGGKKIDAGRIYISASYNNIMVTVTDDKGDVITWASSGSLGFSGPKKATPFASSKIIAAITEKVRKSGPINVHIKIRGASSGRDAALRSLANQGFNILSIEDVTPVPHNGPRPKKPRRI